LQKGPHSLFWACLQVACVTAYVIKGPFLQYV